MTKQEFINYVTENIYTNDEKIINGDLLQTAFLYLANSIPFSSDSLSPKIYSFEQANMSGSNPYYVDWSPELGRKPVGCILYTGEGVKIKDNNWELIEMVLNTTYRIRVPFEIQSSLILAYI